MTAFTLGQASVLALHGMAARQADRGAAARTLRRPPARSGAPHPTDAPVRRDSIEAGTFEELFFAVPAPGETDRLLRIAPRTLDAGRQLRREARAGLRELSKSERLIATLTAGAVRVYEEICTLARLNRGRVFPSYDHLARATALGRATVARALAVLEGIGFLVRQRRFKRIEGEGPRYKQTSNVYRPTFAIRVLGYLPRWMRPAPVPDDQAQHDAARNEVMLRCWRSCRAESLRWRAWAGRLVKCLLSLGLASIMPASLKTSRNRYQVHCFRFEQHWPSRPIS